MTSSKVYAGVLEKYVNLGSGWHRRYFLLKDGSLKYFLLASPGKSPKSEESSLQVSLALAKLRGALGPDLVLIGSEIAAADKPMDAAAVTAYKFPQPRGEVALKRAKVRASAKEEKKFYLEEGTKVTFKMRVGSREERDHWIAAFKDAIAAANKEVAKPPAGAVNKDVAFEDAEFSKTIGQVKDILWQNGMAEEVVQMIERLLQDDHDRICRKVRSLSLKSQPLPADPARPAAHAGEALPMPPGSVLDRTHSNFPLSPGRRGEEEDAGSQRSGGLEGDESSDDDTPEIWFEAPADLPPGGGPSNSLDGRLSPSEKPSPNPSPLQYLSTPTPMALPSPTGENGPVARSAMPGSRRGSVSAAAAQALSSFSALLPRTDSDSESSADPTAFLPMDAAALPTALAAPRPLPPPAWAAREPVPSRRTALPRPVQDPASASFNLWSLIKEAVGRDLTRICLPVYFNEPLSALQKACEDFEFAELLDQAAALPRHSLERTLKVAAFAVAAYSSTEGRTCKPFNPLLNETFEFVAPEKGFRFLAEKVSHQPTILASRCEGRGWVVDGDAEVKSRFWGRSIELQPAGCLRVTFADGESLSWSKVTTSINNLILGKIYIDHAGVMQVTSASGPFSARIRFIEQGVLHRQGHRVAGAVYKAAAAGAGEPTKVCLLEGKWTESLRAVFPQDGGRSVPLWTRPRDAARDGSRYNLTPFAVQLNEVTPGLQGQLAPTDCRLRPDQAALERGEIDRANAEKQRLEKKQRAARKAAEAGTPIHPRWFGAAGAAPHTRPDRVTFEYQGGYWESREAGRFEGTREIFA